MSELNSYIDSLSSAGERQGSEGQFTIDPFKSRQKLQVFRMTRPEYCLLPIIAGADLGGATVIDVRKDSEDSCSVTFDGRLWTYHDFPELLSSKAPIAREFQLGLSAAQALQPGKVVFRSVYGGLESLLTIADGDPDSRHRNIEDDNNDFNQVVIEAARVPFQKPLYELLSERCAYNPRVAWMGRRLIRKSPPDTAGRLQLNDSAIAQPSIVVSAWSAAKVEDAGCSGHLWTTEDTRNLFTFVIHGIAYPKVVTFGSYRGICGVVAAPSLQLDISRENVVEDQTYRDLIDQLKNHTDTVLMPKMKREIRFMPPLKREVAQKFLDQWQRGRN